MGTGSSTSKSGAIHRQVHPPPPQMAAHPILMQPTQPLPQRAAPPFHPPNAGNVPQRAPGTHPTQWVPPPSSQSQTLYPTLPTYTFNQDYTPPHFGPDLFGDTSLDLTLSRIMAADEFLDVSIIMKSTGLSTVSKVIIDGQL